jgi:hypothetical protein
MKYLTSRVVRSLIRLSFVLLLSNFLHAQVGVGTILPDSDSVLDVTSSDKGVLLPRVNLTSTSSFAPLSSNVEGMIVYNQATINDVIPGYYYNSGSAWVALGDANDDWKLNGNASTSPGTNYLGTSDAVDLAMGTAGTERLRIMADGRVSVNDNTPIAGDRFSSTGAVDEDAVNGYSSGAGGVGVYGDNTSTGLGVYGTSTSTGQGVRGFNNGGGYGVAGNNNSTGFGVIGFSSSTGVGAQGQNTGTGIGVVGIVNNGAAEGVVAQNLNAGGVGIAGAANAGYATLPGSGGTFYGVFGSTNFSSSATGTGASGIGNAGGTVYTLSSGSGLSGNGTLTGVYGISTATSGSRQGAYFTMNKSGAVTPAAADDPFAVLAGYDGTDYFGGYFDGNQDNNPIGGGGTAGEDYAYVGIQSGGTTYKIVGTGSNSTLVNDADGNKRVLFSPEAPEILFEDYGSGQLINGTARIDLDPLLSSIIYVSEAHPLRVFIQLEGDCNGVYVTNKNANGFTVTELEQGNSNVSFSWHVVGNRADTVLQDGTVFSKHVDVRFPMGPKKLAPMDISENAVQKITSVIEKDKVEDRIKDSTAKKGLQKN